MVASSQALMSALFKSPVFHPLCNIGLRSGSYHHQGCSPSPHVADWSSKLAPEGSFACSAGGLRFAVICVFSSCTVSTRSGC